MARLWCWLFGHTFHWYTGGVPYHLRYTCTWCGLDVARRYYKPRDKDSVA